MQGLRKALIKAFNYNKIKFIWSVVLAVLFFTFTNLAHAGEQKSLCQKATEADLIFAMTFEVKETYDQKLIDQGWAPDEMTLRKIARTGVVTNVFKGNISINDTWRTGYGILFNQGASVTAWQELFKLPSFTAISFFIKNAGTYHSVGLAEETAGCEVNAQFSFCKEYAAYEKALNQCLTSIKPVLSPDKKAE